MRRVWETKEAGAKSSSQFPSSRTEAAQQGRLTVHKIGVEITRLEPSTDPDLWSQCKLGARSALLLAEFPGWTDEMEVDLSAAIPALQPGTKG